MGKNLWVEAEKPLESPQYVRCVMTAQEYQNYADLTRIEKELGISLIALLKALKQRSLFYRDAETGEIKRCEYCRIGFQDSPCVIFMYVGSGEEQRCCHVDFIDNYGKTYAMTEEELK